MMVSKASSFNFYMARLHGPCLLGHSYSSETLGFCLGSSVLMPQEMAKKPIRHKGKGPKCIFHYTVVLGGKQILTQATEGMDCLGSSPRSMEVRQGREGSQLRAYHQTVGHWSSLSLENAVRPCRTCLSIISSSPQREPGYLSSKPHPSWTEGCIHSQHLWPVPRMEAIRHRALGVCRNTRLLPQLLRPMPLPQLHRAIQSILQSQTWL